ncbi:MAG: hypothetical protein ACOCV2_12475 [Persicimonas sp.]
MSGVIDFPESEEAWFCATILYDALMRRCLECCESDTLQAKIEEATAPYVRFFDYTALNDAEKEEFREGVVYALSDFEERAGDKDAHYHAARLTRNLLEMIDSEDDAASRSR